MTCDHCDGSHWLADNCELGPCVCCTPDALTAAEEELVLTRGQAALEAQHAKTAASEADDYWEAIEAAKSHLADYLVSIGQGAHPVTLPGPLGRLRDAINDVVGWR